MKLSPLFTWRSAIADPDSGLPPTARHVALTLSLHMSERGDSAWPSLSTLAGEVGRTVETIATAIRQLEEAGWLEVTRSKGGRLANGRGIVNIYRAVVPQQSAEPTVNRRMGPEEQSAEPTQGRQESVSTEGSSLRSEPSGAPRPRNLMFDAVAEAVGWSDEASLTRSARSHVAAVARELAEAGASPDDVPMLALFLRRHYGLTGAITPGALAKHYPAYKSGQLFEAARR